MYRKCMISFFVWGFFKWSVFHVIKLCNDKICVNYLLIHLQSHVSLFVWTFYLFILFKFFIELNALFCDISIFSC